MSLVVLAMSGGVDSSVAAHLLLEQGHEVIGVFMRHGEQSPAVCSSSTPASQVVPDPGAVSSCEDSPISASAGVGDDPARKARDARKDYQARDARKNRLQLPVVNRLDHKQGCCTAADAEDARRVSDRLNIPFYALDLNEEFAQIMDYFADEYARGRTPNPCVQCNNWIKFGKLFDYADSVGAEFVATGHYARLAERDGETVLLRGVDAGKDQSYVLFGIKQPLLKRMMLPVGGYEKPAIREMAAGVGLNVAEKKDSQEICFVTQGRYDEFVKRRLASRVVPDTGAVSGREGSPTSASAGVEDDPAREARFGSRAGQLVTTDGTVVGEHAGIEGFTVGQRKGLGVALGERKFVVRIEPDTNRVVLGDRSEMLGTQLTAEKCNWLVEVPLNEPVRCYAQIRYNATAASAEMIIREDQRLEVKFDEGQFGVAPGQAVVCYDGDRVLGGGWIV